MSYKDVSSVSALRILDIFCDKMNFSLPPSFNLACLVALHILEKVHSKRHSWGVKDQFLAIFNDSGELLELSTMYEMW